MGPQGPMVGTTFCAKKDSQIDGRLDRPVGAAIRTRAILGKLVDGLKLLEQAGFMFEHEFFGVVGTQLTAPHFGVGGRHDGGGGGSFGYRLVSCGSLEC